MKRLTKRTKAGTANIDYDGCTFPNGKEDYIAKSARRQLAIERFAAIEDILGDEYDLDWLQVIMDAEQHGGLIVGYGPGDPGEPGELGVMEEVAADYVVVVRCRECAHYKICDEWENGKRMLCEIHHHSYLDHDGDNHFCSWGQRKIEGVRAISPLRGTGR